MDFARSRATFNSAPSFEQSFDKRRIFVRNSNDSWPSEGIFSFKTLLVGSDVSQRRMKEQVVLNSSSTGWVFFWQAFKVEIDLDFKVSITAFPYHVGRISQNCKENVCGGRRSSLIFLFYL